MKTKYFIFYIVIAFLIISSVVLTNKILAQETADAANIQYPVEELGNCQSQTDCRAYCNKPENLKVCLNFAKENNLMSDEELSQAEKFLAAGGEGPGGCKGKEECEEYCNNISHIDECISYAQKNNLIPPEELEEAKKVQSAIKRGIKPPPCGNKQQCDVYCEEPEHMEECITFGVEAGFIQGKEAEDAQKMLQAVKRGVKPPPCRGKAECDEYCSNPDNMEVCMNFAMEAGMMSEQEKADSEKMLQALKKGVKPPNCRGKEECDVYCQQQEHFEECMDFAVAAGFMSEEDAQMARKTGGKGPGACKGKEECEAFCDNPDNQETCFNFAKDNGMILEEELQRMEEGKQQMRQALDQAPAEVLECLQGEIGADMVEKMKNGVMPPRDIGDKMQTCFQKMGPPQGPMQECEGENCPPPCQGENCQFGSPQQAGPGGCKTPEECQNFCQNNPEQCQNFRPSEGQEGQIPPGPQQEFQPCQGENCQFGPPPSCEGENCAQMPPPPDGSMGPPPEGNYIPSGPGEIMPPPPTESAPPAGFIINTNSLVGSLIYAVFQFLIGQ